MLITYYTNENNRKSGCAPTLSKSFVLKGGETMNPKLYGLGISVNVNGFPMAGKELVDWKTFYKVTKTDPLTGFGSGEHYRRFPELYHALWSGRTTMYDVFAARNV